MYIESEFPLHKANVTADVYLTIPLIQLLKNMDDDISQSNVFLEVINKSGYTPQQLHQIEQRRITKLVKEFTSKGYTCITNQQFFSGVDIFLFNKQWRLCVVVESANYSITSRMGPVAFNRYMTQFRFYADVDKLLVISFNQNISKTQQQAFIKSGVQIRVEGQQD